MELNNNRMVILQGWGQFTLSLLQIAIDVTTTTTIVGESKCSRPLTLPDDVVFD